MAHQVGIDTAYDYKDQVNISKHIAGGKRKGLFILTKIPTAGPSSTEQTRARLGLCLVVVVASTLNDRSIPGHPVTILSQW